MLSMTRLDPEGVALHLEIALSGASPNLQSDLQLTTDIDVWLRFPRWPGVLQTG
jgi:hypothetical protein